MENFAVFGINYKIAKSEIREKVALNSSLLCDALNIASSIFDETILVSTCNRTEVYVADSKDNLKERLKGYIKELFKIEEGILERFYFFSQEEALFHLVKVASSLDSMVVGEAEILGQLKSAYKTSLAKKTAAKTLNAMFQHSFRVAKRIRTETDIAKGNYSIPSIACRLALEKLENLRNKIVMVIGGGKISCVTLKHLIDKGTKTIFIGNRTFERALELAKRFGGIALYFKDCFERLSECHLVISQTSSPHYLIRKKDIPPSRKRPLVLIDLAIPRDIEPSIKNLKDVFLYNIDALQETSNKIIKKREGEIERALLIIKEEIDPVASRLFNRK